MNFFLLLLVLKKILASESLNSLFTTFSAHQTTSLTKSIGIPFKLPAIKLKAIDVKLENSEINSLSNLSPVKMVANLDFIVLKLENPYYLWKIFNISSNKSNASNINLTPSSTC